MKQVVYTPEVRPFENLVESLCLYMVEHNSLETTVLNELTINFAHDKKNAKNPIGLTGGYDPDYKSIILFVTGRQLTDILRSLAHEMQHFAQDCKGIIPKDAATSEGYAQKDKTLRSLEEDAYLTGNILFRDWRDTEAKELVPQRIEESKMTPAQTVKNAKNNEMNRILMENIAKRTGNKVLLEQISVDKEFPEDGTRIDKIRWIVNEHQAQKIDGITIDATTANLILAVWNRLNKQENKDKFEKLPIKSLAYFAIEQGKQQEEK